MCDSRQNESGSSDYIENSCIPSITIKWGSENCEINDLYDDTTVRDLKDRIYEKIGIRQDRQKLLNLCKGKLPNDNQTIGELGIKSGFKLIVMGSKEEDIDATIYSLPTSTKLIASQSQKKKILEQCNQVIPERKKIRGIENNVDYEIYLTKIQQKIRNHRLRELSQLDGNKKLLVLGINDGLTSIKLKRQSMYEFLSQVYQYYNIVIWSSSTSESIKKKLISLSENQNYKIFLYLDQHSMITTFEPNYGSIRIKPLDLIWMNYPKYSEKNTIIIEDKWLNVIINEESALIINQFSGDEACDSNQVLMRIGDYLKLIGGLKDFRGLNHKKWIEYINQESRRRLIEKIGPLPDEREIINFLNGTQRFDKLNLGGENDQIMSGDIKRVKLETDDTFYEKIERKFEEYNFKEVTPLRSDKKLLILDLDHTLFDPEYNLARPYLHEFLAKVYKHYDIIVWSSSSEKWTTRALVDLNMLITRIYRIAYYLDGVAMISVKTPKKIGPISVKPLGLIWRKFSRYSAKNTIIIDDERTNFLMNPQSGLEIQQFKLNQDNCQVDGELQLLTEYLELIADVEDFRALNHQDWKKYRNKNLNN